MIVEDISTALEARLVAFGGKIQREGEVLSASITQPYVSGQMAVRQSTQLGIGHNAPRFWSGVYRVLVAQPRSDGMAAALAKADMILQHFPRGLTLTAGSAALVIEQGTVEPSYSAVDWINVPVLIRWFCEEPSS